MDIIVLIYSIEERCKIRWRLENICVRTQGKSDISVADSEPLAVTTVV